MKDIKTFLIGFLTCACMFLIMGQTDSRNPVFDSIWAKEILLFDDNGATKIMPNQITLVDNHRDKSVMIKNGTIMLSSDSTKMHNHLLPSSLTLGYNNIPLAMITSGKYPNDNYYALINLSDSKEQQVLNLLPTNNGNGLIETYKDGILAGSFGSGVLRTYNKHGVDTGYFGNNTEEDGMSYLNDRYGDAGWGVSGKK